jgi:hypothetical protein
MLARYDYPFVPVADGRQWYIPAASIAAFLVDGERRSPSG